jgi:hypothetical protein
LAARSSGYGCVARLEAVAQLVVVAEFARVILRRIAAENVAGIHELLDRKMILQPEQSAEVIVVRVANEDGIDLLHARLFEERDNQVAASIEPGLPAIGRCGVWIG